MMVRLNTRWNQPKRSRSYKDTGSIVAVNMWKLAVDSLLQIENEGFETQTRMQRLAVVVELLAYLLHLLDRIAHEHSEDETRTALVSATAQKLIQLVQTNHAEIGGQEDRTEDFTRVLNTRGSDYAECRLQEGKPGFTMRRLFGEFVQKVLGEKDRQWAADYVQDVIAPKLYTGLYRTVRPLF